ncbi:MAG: ATP-binding protein [Rhizomicrobium sp.]|nr:ATP-binding protein [Rhizomicrobium sp.]
MSKVLRFFGNVKLRIFRMDRSKLVGTAALLSALGLTLLSASFVYTSINHLHAAFGWVQHTNRVILQMTTIEKNLLSADSTMRAQAYSGERLNFFNTRMTNASIQTDVEHLAVLVADNPDQIQRVLRLQTVIAARAIASPKREGAEFDRMSDIRSKIEDMRTVEWQLLQTRIAAKEHATVTSLFLATLTGFLALALGSLGIYLLTRESAHRRFAELELMRIQRLNMMSLTTMALAHEINQPLAAAGNYLAASLRLAKAPDANVPTKIIDAATNAQEQVLRASKIIKRLRGFIAKSEEERTIESPGIIIEDAISLIGTIDSSIKVETNIEADLPCVSVDRIQLQQVLINLIRNSIEALGGGKRSELMLSVMAINATLVRFDVRDNGPGLAKSIRENLFKPFISTKSGGMGVGLMICKAIIISHGGQISASNGPDGGTIISFTLPALPQQIAA